jgi:hypothetical protein
VFCVAIDCPMAGLGVCFWELSALPMGTTDGGVFSRFVFVAFFAAFASLIFACSLGVPALCLC